MANSLKALSNTFWFTKLQNCEISYGQYIFFRIFLAYECIFYQTTHFLFCNILCFFWRTINNVIKIAWLNKQCWINSLFFRFEMTPLFEYYLDGVTLTSISIFGIFGTLLSLRVLLKLRNSFSSILSGLAVSDTFFLFFAIVIIGLPKISQW